MPAQLALPSVAANYPSLPQPLVVPAGYVPKEGPRAIPLNIAWGTDDVIGAGASGAVYFNLSQLAASPQPFSQLAALYVDNTQSGADVTFMFPDRQFELVVAAGDGGIFPVISGNMIFYAVALSALNTDKTFFQALNYIPSPETFGKTVFMTTVAAATASPPVVAATQILPNGTNGTLIGYRFAEEFITSTGAGGATIDFSLRDGTPTTLRSVHLATPAATTTRPPYIETVTGINQRFFNGLVLNVAVVTNVAAAGPLNVEVYFRTP